MAWQMLHLKVRDWLASYKNALMSWETIRILVTCMLLRHIRIGRTVACAIVLCRWILTWSTFQHPTVYMPLRVWSPPQSMKCLLVFPHFANPYSYYFYLKSLHRVVLWNCFFISRDLRTKLSIRMHRVDSDTHTLLENNTRYCQILLLVNFCNTPRHF